ncbi:helix-turn-helix transcriptional regulator [Ornithinibacillus scapharcae]|uniref:helix-turn-helix transcriptional regulator n=1 Tax=Ornithinibacillus scapharcae TaxID=1147159 RepID=UPI000225B83D|nr:helix-turn-helix transcriptional regulator [Ornithinibacillus scapharcae]
MENRIKEYREKKSISQGKLAEICDVSRQTINAIENNKYDPSLQLAFDIAENLGVTMEELFIPKKEREKWIKPIKS